MRKAIVANMLAMLAFVPLMAQDAAPAWKLIKVFSDRGTIINSIEVIDPSWHQLQFRWKAPCSARRSLLLIASPKEKGAKALGAQSMDNIAESGSYVLSIPQGTASVTLMMSGDRCLSGLEIEVLAPYTPPEVSSTNSKADLEFDFRQTKWAMSKEQVIAAEGKPASDEPDR